MARCLAVTWLWVAGPSLAESPVQASLAGPAPEARAPEPPGYSLWSLRASLSTEVGSSLRPVGLGFDVQPYRHLRVGLYADALLDLSVGGRVLVPVFSVAPTPALSLSLMPGLGVDRVLPRLQFSVGLARSNLD